MACTWILLAACNSGDIVSPQSVASSAQADVSLGDAQVATRLSNRVRISVTSASGNPVAGAKVSWTASHGQSSQSTTHTNASGIAVVDWTLGEKAGAQQLVARVDGLAPVVFEVNATPAAPDRIVFPSSSVRLPLLGDTIWFDAFATDRFGNRVAEVPSYMIDGPTGILEAIDGGRGAIAAARGTAMVRASLHSAQGTLDVSVDPAAPRPVRIANDTIRPGMTFTIEGDAFPLLRELAEVRVNGVVATVLSITRTRIDAALPTTGLPCQATGQAVVRVSAAGASGELRAPLRVATRLQLARGESANLLDAASVRCTELVAPAEASNARFIVAVINTNQSVSGVSRFELHGRGTGEMSGVVASQHNAAIASVRTDNTPALNAPARRQLGDHGRHLETQRTLTRNAGSPLAAWSRKSGTNTAFDAATVQHEPGQIVTVNALYNSCSTGRPVQARVVYAGSRALVLEDVASPRAGTMDADFRAIGEEFDAVQYPLIRDNLGDPLALNGVLGGDGRVTMLFTRFVNDSLPGTAGYVSACNFYPKATFAASNENEVFYARLPLAGETPAQWRRNMRSTVVHETKHIASYAERIARSFPFEELWLEEATARIAEELYSRRFAGGGSWKGNTRFQSSVGCEINACDDRPLLMWRHFAALHAFQKGVDSLSPIGPSSASDFTYYASGWSLVRWAADHYATSESQWLRDLVRGGAQIGLANLAARTGRPVGELLGDWALALATDDIEGFAPQRNQLTFPSWHSADVMGGLAQAFPGTYVASPLTVRAYTFGQFQLTVDKLRGFSTSYFSFSGRQTGSQLIELKGQDGTDAPGSLRLAVVRVQ